MLMDTVSSTPPADWHPADVKAALEKRGISLRSLAREYGYSHIQRVLTSQWWAAEQIVARAIGMQAADIWPSRYTAPRTRGQGMTRNADVLKLASKARRAATRTTRRTARALQSEAA